MHGFGQGSTNLAWDFLLGPVAARDVEAKAARGLGQEIFLSDTVVRSEAITERLYQA